MSPNISHIATQHQAKYIICELTRITDQVLAGIELIITS